VQFDGLPRLRPLRDRAGTALPRVQPGGGEFHAPSERHVDVGQEEAEHLAAASMLLRSGTETCSPSAVTFVPTSAALNSPEHMHRKVILPSLLVI
jgi:hypothetical protein